MKQYHYLTAGVLAAFLLIGSVTDSRAQRRPNTRFIPYSTVSFGAGSATYYGDLAGYGKVLKATVTLPRWNVGLGYTRQFTPNFAARATFTWARIVGDDYTFNRNNYIENAQQYARNLHFRNDLKEFALTGVYNFVADGRNSTVRAKFTPYVFGGVALLAHSPEARTPAAPNNEPYEAQKWVKLQPLHTEGQGQPGNDKPYSLVTASIPVGFGVRYALNENFTVAAEIGYRYSFTDYLDDVGGQPYPDPTTLEGLASKMSDRRFERNAARYKNAPDRYTKAQEIFNQNPEAFSTPIRGADGRLNDGYLLTNISIHYIIPGKIKCPPIK